MVKEERVTLMIYNNNPERGKLTVNDVDVELLPQPDSWVTIQALDGPVSKPAYAFVKIKGQRFIAHMPMIGDRTRVTITEMRSSANALHNASYDNVRGAIKALLASTDKYTAKELNQIIEDHIIETYDKWTPERKSKHPRNQQKKPVACQGAKRSSSALLVLCFRSR